MLKLYFSRAVQDFSSITDWESEFSCLSRNYVWRCGGQSFLTFQAEKKTCICSICHCFHYPALSAVRYIWLRELPAIFWAQLDLFSQVTFRWSHGSPAVSLDTLFHTLPPTTTRNSFISAITSEPAPGRLDEGEPRRKLLSGINMWMTARGEATASDFLQDGLKIWTQHKGV